MRPTLGAPPTRGRSQPDQTRETSAARARWRSRRSPAVPAEPTSSSMTTRGRHHMTTHDERPLAVRRGRDAGAAIIVPITGETRESVLAAADGNHTHPLDLIE